MFQASRHVGDLFQDLRDGHNLISLLEVLSGEHLVSITVFLYTLCRLDSDFDFNILLLIFLYDYQPFTIMVALMIMSIVCLIVAFHNCSFKTVSSNTFDRASSRILSLCCILCMVLVIVWILPEKLVFNDRASRQQIRSSRSPRLSQKALQNT